MRKHLFILFILTSIFYDAHSQSGGRYNDTLRQKLGMREAPFRTFTDSLKQYDAQLRLALQGPVADVNSKAGRASAVLLRKRQFLSRVLSRKQHVAYQDFFKEEDKKHVSKRQLGHQRMLERMRNKGAQIKP